MYYSNFHLKTAEISQAEMLCELNHLLRLEKFNFLGCSVISHSYICWNYKKEITIIFFWMPLFTQLDIFKTWKLLVQLLYQYFSVGDAQDAVGPNGQPTEPRLCHACCQVHQTVLAERGHWHFPHQILCHWGIISI